MRAPDASEFRLEPSAIGSIENRFGISCADASGSNYLNIKSVTCAEPAAK